MAEVTCDKCDKFYVDPRMLLCLHSFCLECLEKELETQETQSSLHCPSCKEKVTLTENGVSDIPRDLHKANEGNIARIREKVEDADDFCDNCGKTDSTGKAVAYCIECEDYLCKFCEGKHGKRRITADHSLITIGDMSAKAYTPTSMGKFYQPQMFCQQHKAHPLDTYCKECQELICIACMNFDHDKHREQCKHIERVAKGEIESLQAYQGDIETAVASLDTAIAKCKENIEKVEARKREVDSAITNSLEQARKALLTQTEAIRFSKRAGLEAQVDQLQRVRDGLSFAFKMIADTQSHSPAHLLSTKSVLAERTENMQREYQVSNLSPSQSSKFLTDISDQPIINKIISLGWVICGGHPASSTCNAGYLPRAVVGVPRTIKVVAHDKQGKALDKGGDEVAAKLVQTVSQYPPITGETIDHGDGTYSVSVTPEAVGEHELHVTLDGLHVNGSPFKYSITNPRAPAYTALSAQYPSISTSTPYDVALTEEGHLAVAEYGCHTVSLYSVTGQKIHPFGTANSYGSGDEQFYNPSAVAIRGDLMYVCEQTNNRVQKFSIKQRAFISKFGTSGGGNNQFLNPRGICIDPEGKVFIADYGNNRIQVFNKDDSFAYSIPCQGNPWGLAFDLQGHLHVAARSLNCINVFIPDGTLVTSYGSGTISTPAGIAIDAEGYIAIGENGGYNRLWIYNPDHTPVHTLSNQFNGGGNGIACDENNSFWVADYGYNRFVKY